MIVLSLEEFAPRRRSTQERIEDALRPTVREAVSTTTNTGGYSELLNAVAEQWRTTYAEESGSAPRGMPASFRDSLSRTLRKTDRAGADSNTVERITVWLATAILTSATTEAAIDDPEELFLEWVDMRDTKVRESHENAHGQQRPPGEKFDVGGAKMSGPGDPSVEPALWMNCRCTLRPVLASEALTASTFAHDLIYVENRRTPKVVNRGAKYKPTPAEGKIVKREKADAADEKAIARGDWVRKNEHGDKPGAPGYKRKKSKVRPGPHTNSITDEGGFLDVVLEALREAGSDLLAYEVDGYAPLEEPTHAGFAVIAADSRRVLMLQRSWDETDDPDVRGTWEFPGGSIDEGETPEQAARREFTEETGLPIPEGEVTNGWRSPDGVYQGFVYTVPVEKDAFEEINPDHEAAEITNPDDPQRRDPDVTAWFTIDQVQNLGPALRPAVAKMDWSVFGPAEKESDMPDDDLNPAEGETPTMQADSAIPWHGVLAPEDVKSGDGRMFAANSLRMRNLPMPLTWQKISDDGHKGNVTVARIDRVARVDGEMRASGVFLSTPEADEVMGLLADFGKFGVSVDADDSTFEMDEDKQAVVFTDARICSACIVPIPAFMEAWVSLGQTPPQFMPDDEQPAEDKESEEGECVKWDDDGKCIERKEPAEPEEKEDDEKPFNSLVAAATFADVAPGITEDGPGWLTRPVDTDRLRDYWVSGAGAAKIGWGSPGDFNRCRVAVAEYVKPQYLNGYCANRHFDATGTWPGQNNRAADALEFTEPAEALSLVASIPSKAPAEWFRNPEFAPGDGRMVQDKAGNWACPQFIGEDGRVFGHIAAWKTCHNAWADTCVLPPHSSTGYAHFLLGEVLTTEGRIPVGSLTIGGGHAGGRLGLRAAIEHYDSTSTVFADVAVGEDEFGIWYAGWLRPGISDDMVHAARASKVSGDWRYSPQVGHRELVAALAVNAPGFAIPRVAAASVNGVEMSLVAAGVVAPEEGTPEVSASFDADSFADAIIARMDARERNRAEMARISKAVQESFDADMAERRGALAVIAAGLEMED